MSSLKGAVRDESMRLNVLKWAAVYLASTSAAGAADWYTGVEEVAQPKPQPSVAIDFAFEATSQQAFSGAMIGTIAPFSSLSESGLRIRVGGFGGSYVYYASEPWIGRVNGYFEQGAAMLGYAWVDRLWQLALFGGIEVSHDGISPNDPNNTVKGTHAGLRIGADLYARPSEQTMVSTVTTYSTDHNAYYARLKFGLAIGNGVFAGPEALALGDDFFHQWRSGLHLTGLQFGGVQFGVSGGYLRDEVRGPGGYGLLDARLTF